MSVTGFAVIRCIRRASVRRMCFSYVFLIFNRETAARMLI